MTNPYEEEHRNIGASGYAVETIDKVAKNRKASLRDVRSGAITSDEIFEIDVWQHQQFRWRNGNSKLVAIGGLAEEVGEVARCAVKMDQGIRGDEDYWYKELRKEIGDVFIKLVDVCCEYNIQIIPAIHDRIVSILERDWNIDPQNGGQSEQ